MYLLNRSTHYIPVAKVKEKILKNNYFLIFFALYNLINKIK